MSSESDSGPSSFVSLTLWLAKLVEFVEYNLQVPFYHLLVEVLLVIWIIKLLTRKSYIPKEPRLELTKEEEDKLIDEWKPEPLISSDAKLKGCAVHPKIIDGKAGKYIKVDGEECLNLGTMNFLGFVGNEKVEKAAIATLRKYGVGTCGPRGFYGTIDVHLELEKKLADYIGTEEAILYSYGFSAISSAIPAYAKRTDVIFCDEGVSFPIQKGIEASRSKVYWFKHNDMKDLEKKFIEQHEKDVKNPKKAAVTRRFLVVEGLYVNYGDVVPLPKLVELKDKYKVRLFIDESASFGVLGKHGKGITEYFNMPFTCLDMIAVSLELSLGTVGGFCAGTSFVVDHQRLSGQGYCFSASLPPLLTVAATTGIQMMEDEPAMFAELQQISTKLHEKLTSISGCVTSSQAVSPIKHLRLDTRVFGNLSYDREEELLEKLADYCLGNKLAVTVARYLNHLEMFPVKPSLRVCASRLLTSDDINLACRTLEAGFAEILK